MFSGTKWKITEFKKILPKNFIVKQTLQEKKKNANNNLNSKT